jgi:NAD(P)-dependent dehydrogenase (short-subunit alcohol dehydrogenase family)
MPVVIYDVTEDLYDRFMAVNAKGPFFIIQYAGRARATAAGSSPSPRSTPACIRLAVRCTPAPRARWSTSRRWRRWSSAGAG